jgi:PIN domain nuclease of toxin-antitoxin system
MDLILDTHALVWLLIGDGRLGPRQVEIIEDPASRVFISAVTGYEIANKFRTGKMPEAGPVLELMKSEFAAYDWLHLPVTLQHAQHAGGLSGEHRDPFDRLLAAQAIIGSCRVMTVDPAFKAFGVEVVW